MSPSFKKIGVLECSISTNIVKWPLFSYYYTTAIYKQSKQYLGCDFGILIIEIPPSVPKLVFQVKFDFDGIHNSLS